MLIDITDRFGNPTLQNMALVTLVVPSPNGGTLLYPRSQNARYDGAPVESQSPIQRFHGLRGFITVDAAHYEVQGHILVNTARVTSVTENPGNRKLSFLNSEATLYVTDSLQDIRDRARKSLSSDAYV